MKYVVDVSLSMVFELDVEATTWEDAERKALEAFGHGKGVKTFVHVAAQCQGPADEEC